MEYEILFDATRTRPYAVIERDNYNGEDLFTVHSWHEDQDTAQLVKEALKARAAKN